MLWQPDSKRVASSSMQRFIDYIDKRFGLEQASYACLYQFSIDRSDEFWRALLSFYEVIYEGKEEPVNTDSGFDRYGWFPKLRLNFAENLLRCRASDDIALVSLREGGLKESLSYRELASRVALLQQALSESFEEGDVLACYMPNIAETVVAMLAATGLGGVFTSTSSDFGAAGVIDRFAQSKPRVLVACASYQYNGKSHSCLSKIKEVVDGVPSIERVFIVDFLGNVDGAGIGDIRGAQWWHECMPPSYSYREEKEAEKLPLRFVRRRFSDPVYIMYSSGTTGKPKCIVHAVGGVLLQHIKELGLHTDVNPQKNIMFFTTCGWMMWNWLVSALFFGGTTTLYEGSPGYPSLQDFLRLIAREKVNIFGTSPKFLKALEDQRINLSSIDLSSLETILSTGAPLLPEQFDYVYREVKSDLMLSSIAGGTDIVGCFFLGNPVAPVYRGELQCRGLGMAVKCFNEQGGELVDSASSASAGQGELVCTQSFPSRPIGFLNDPNGERINEAYFNRFPGVWYHGDFIAITEYGGAKFFGRSDATLNPGGVRIGTSEIYRQVESLPYIEDSVCVGKHREGDVDVLLFVKLLPEEELCAERELEIKQRIKANATPRHVPQLIAAVKDIPYTRSGKKIEIAVSKIVNGHSLSNKEAIANPESLEEYAFFR